MVNKAASEASHHGAIQVGKTTISLLTENAVIRVDRAIHWHRVYRPDRGIPSRGVQASSDICFPRSDFAPGTGRRGERGVAQVAQSWFIRHIMTGRLGGRGGIDAKPFNGA